MFCYPVEYESFEQLVGVAEQGDPGRKRLVTDGSFPGFSSATTLASRQIFGTFLVSVQLLKKLLLPWLVPSSGVAGIADDRIPPCCPVCRVVLFHHCLDL